MHKRSISEKKLREKSLALAGNEGVATPKLTNIKPLDLEYRWLFLEINVAVKHWGITKKGGKKEKQT